jgi:hypothetical protein
MSKKVFGCFVVAIVLVAAVLAGADIAALAKCQKVFAREGSTFALRVIRSNLKCADGISDCQIQCEEGVFGPPCDSNPPPCCDPDDTGSNPEFADCMTKAQGVCDAEVLKRAQYEINKQDRIKTACTVLTPDELCGAQTEGLNFATLNAGCLALDPTYTCTLDNLIACVGGPLEHQLIDQISFVLEPRISDSIVTAGLQSQYPDVPLAQKVKDTVPAGKMDVWAFNGQAGDQIIARVTTRVDISATSISTLHPQLTLLDSSNTPVLDSTVRSAPCGVPNACGSSCPLFKRTLPSTGRSASRSKACPTAPAPAASTSSC